MYVKIKAIRSHHLEPLAPAERLVGLPLREVVFGSPVGPQPDGLLGGRRVVLVLLVELLQQQVLKVPQVPSGPLVGGGCRGKAKPIVSGLISCRAERHRAASVTKTF